MLTRGEYGKLLRERERERETASCTLGQYCKDKSFYSDLADFYNGITRGAETFSNESDLLLWGKLLVLIIKEEIKGRIYVFISVKDHPNNGRDAGVRDL